MTTPIYFIPGDGIGPEVMQVARQVMDAAMEKNYGHSKKLVWHELLAGEKAYKETGTYLPEETLSALTGASLAIKGPLTTPVGGGFRSLNVTMRQALDLYACIRPIRYFPGVKSPLKQPEDVDMIVFRENTEDVYAGIEYAAGTSEAKILLDFLSSKLGAKIDENAGIGIKPMTEKASKRLISKAISHAIDHKKESVTLVHKGNIMKYTEGAFCKWGYELAQEKFSSEVIAEHEAGAGNKGRVILKDRIADAMFQNALLSPCDYSVLATSNLNGDYLSDALAAQVGGLGLAPGVNMSDTLALFEATHGTAPAIAGKDRANPVSIVLSGAMLFAHAGFHNAAQAIEKAVEKALAGDKLTYDLAAHNNTAEIVGCKAFGEILLQFF